MVWQKKHFPYYNSPMPLYRHTASRSRHHGRKREGRGAILCGNGTMREVSSGACRDIFRVEVLKKLSHPRDAGQGTRSSMPALSHNGIWPTRRFCFRGRNTPYEKHSVRGMPRACKPSCKSPYCRGASEDAECP